MLPWKQVMVAFGIIKMVIRSVSFGFEIQTPWLWAPKYHADVLIELKDLPSAWWEPETCTCSTCWRRQWTWILLYFPVLVHLSLGLLLKDGKEKPCFVNGLSCWGLTSRQPAVQCYLVMVVHLCNNKIQRMWNLWLVCIKNWTDAEGFHVV